MSFSFFYSDEVQHHFLAALEEPHDILSPSHSTSFQGNSSEVPSRIKFYASLTEDGILAQLTFKAYANPEAIALAHLISEQLKGQPYSRLMLLKSELLLNALKIPAEHISITFGVLEAVKDLYQNIDQSFNCKTAKPSFH